MIIFNLNKTRGYEKEVILRWSKSTNIIKIYINRSKRDTVYINLISVAMWLSLTYCAKILFILI